MITELRESCRFNLKNTLYFLYSNIKITSLPIDWQIDLLLWYVCFTCNDIWICNMGLCFAIRKIRWFEYVFTKTKKITVTMFQYIYFPTETRKWLNILRNKLSVCVYCAVFCLSFSSSCVSCVSCFSGLSILYWPFNFPFICSDVPSTHVYRVHFCQGLSGYHYDKNTE